jgi:hypothetical protein
MDAKDKHPRSKRATKGPEKRIPGKHIGIVAHGESKRMASSPAASTDIVFPGIVSPCASTALTNHGGAFASGLPVQLIFWGPAWQTLFDPSNPGQLLSDTFTAAVKSILAGPWISALRQYGVHRCPFGGSMIYTSSGPALLPNTLQEQNVQDLLQSLIDDGTFPEPDDAGGANLYFVMLPPNTQMTPIGNRGAHSSFNSGSFIDSDNVWYAWIGSNSISGMTSTFCHELAEMCTNPEDGAWFIDGAGPLCFEIGDVCNLQDGPLKGVNVESYWSIYDGACIIPTAWSVRRTLAAAGITLGGKGLRSLEDPNASMNQLIVSL